MFKEARKRFTGRKDLIFIIFLGLIPLFSWFKDDFLIIGGDMWYLINPSSLTEYFKYFWNVKVLNAGYPHPVQDLFPMLLFWSFFQNFGISIIITQKLWITFLFLFPGISMYYLMSVIYNNKWAKITSATLYMFNIYLLQVGPYQPNVKLVLIALPLMLAFLIKGLDNKQLFRYSFLIGLTSLIYAQSNVNPPLIIVASLVLFTYLLFHILSLRSNVFHNLKFFSMIFLIYLLVNVWWIGTYSYYAITQYSIIKGVTLFAALNTGGLTEFFRLFGSWAWGYHMYFPYNYHYDTHFLILITFLVPLLVFIPILLERKNKNILFFTTLAIIGIFLAKGTAEPFGYVYEFLYNELPGFFIFREPFAKFTLITLFSYSILLGISTDIICKKIKKWELKRNYSFRLSNIFPILILIIVLTSAFPLITGDVILNHTEGPMRTFYVKIPEYWHNVGYWSHSQDENFRIFLTPKSGYGSVYNWEHGYNGEPAIMLLQKPVLKYSSFPMSYTDNFVNTIYDHIKPDSPKQVAKLLGMLNSRYVLQQNDLAWDLGVEDTYSSMQMREILQNQSGINLQKSFGKLDLYKISDEYFLPHIYASPDKTGLED